MKAVDAVKSRSWRLSSRQTIKQVFFIAAPGTRGISPPNLCTEETQLLGIYVMLTYILITFQRNAYHRRGPQIILQPPYLCSLHTCSPKAQAPKRIIQESLVLQPSQLFTKNQDLFLTTW